MNRSPEPPTLGQPTVSGSAHRVGVSPEDPYRIGVRGPVLRGFGGLTRLPWADTAEVG